MKRIIMAIAIAAGMALGGAASGQTQEEVNEIIRRAQQIELKLIGFCPFVRSATGERRENDGEYYAGILMDIKRTHDKQVRRAKITDSQLMEAICRYMSDMK